MTKAVQRVKPFVIITEHPNKDARQVIYYFKAAGITLNYKEASVYGLTTFGYGYHLVFGERLVDIKSLLKEVEKQLVDIIVDRPEDNTH